MNDGIKREIYSDYLNGFTILEIAERNNISKSKVDRIIQSIKGSLEHRLSNVAIFEFEQYFIKFRDSIEKDIADITSEIERENGLDEPDFDRIDELRDQRHSRRKDLWLLLGDGEMVLVLRKMKKNERASKESKTTN